MPPHIVRYPPIQCNTRERCDQLQIPAAPSAWRVPEGPDNLPAAPMGGGRAWPGFDGKLHHTQRRKRRRCGGQRRDRRARPGCWWAATGPGRAIHSHLAPLVRRAPEGSVGLAAVPVGGDGAWPGFEATRRAKLAARTARGRAAAHGHNQQPGPTAHHAAARQGRRASTQLVHVLDTVERQSIQRSRAATTSATWTAFRAAPLRRLSPETTRMRPRLPSTA